jgi:flagellin
MALMINHNIAALDAQRNLAQTTRSIGQVMEKLSSGYRINRASDDPAGLVISEQFRAQIAGLNRAISNSEGSINMIQTAEGSLNEINSLLVSMRELAIHAANEGFNDANQLAADQAEIENAIKTIDRIAANTQFGTKRLLDGTKDNIATITTANTSSLTVLKSYLNSGSHSITATKTADSTATLNTTSLGVSLSSTGSPADLEEKIHNIDVLQASEGATKTSSAIAVSDAFGNGLKLGAAAANATIYTSNTLSAATIGTNAGTYTLVMNYQENNEAVTGDQTLSIAVASGDTLANIVTKWNTAIANNSSLAGKISAATITAGATGNRLLFKSVNQGSQYSLKLTSSTTTATSSKLTWGATRSNRGTSLNVLNFTATTVKNAGTTSAVTIGAATYTSMSTLATAIKAGLATAFGTVSGTTNNVDVEVTDTNKLRFFTYDEGSSYKLQHNSTGSESERAYNVLGLSADTLAISGTDAIVSFDGYSTAITSVKYASTGSTTLYNKESGSAGRGSINLVIGQASNGINVGNLLLDVKAAKFDVRLDAGPATQVTAGKDATVYNSDRTQSLKVRYGLTSQGGSESITNTDQSLVFQIGGNVGQTAAIGLRNMATSSLGKNLAGNMYESLAKINVETVSGAQDAQAVIDAAIDEVSNTRGTLGSFQKNTLESNLRNLRVAAQNLTSSESGIRDTDMASTMSEFVKNQILLQAGTAMLAQGNQLPQVVLSLFK